jgi:hypothetical protein
VTTPKQPDPARLTTQYEALRAQALAGSAAIATPLGLAVLLQRGLVAWVAVCIELVPAASPPDRLRPAVCPPPAVVPIGVHAEAVRVLASMALAACQKGGS